MPLISSQDVIDYTENDKVRKRAPKNLSYDIIAAEAEVSRIFIEAKKDLNATLKVDGEGNQVAPDKVKLAIIMWAEYYALKGINRESDKTSEQFDDYSYQKAEILPPDVSSLLHEYLWSNIKSPINFRMRKV